MLANAGMNPLSLACKGVVPFGYRNTEAGKNKLRALAASDGCVFYVDSDTELNF